MESTTISPRAVTSLLVLLVCAVASLRATDVRPPRIVTEIVSVVFMSPRGRTPAVEPGEMTALAASGTADSRMRPAASEPAERQLSTTKPRAQLASFGDVHAGSTLKLRIRPAARVARLRHAASLRQASAAARQRPSGSASRDGAGFAVAPALPALFVPLQRLGLSIQAKLVGPEARQAILDRTEAGRRRQKRAGVPAA